MTRKKKLMKWFVSLALVSAMMLSALFTACGGGNSGDVPVGDRTVIKFWPSSNQYTAQAFNDLVKEYNNTQGVLDGVYVQVDLTKVDVSSNHFSICPTNVRNQTDILTVSDRSVFYGASYPSGSFYSNMSTLAADESLRTKDADGNYVFDINDFADVTIERFYYNRATKEAGNIQTGTLYALPFGSNPTLLIYNETFFKSANINIISVKEEDLDEYNATNGTTYAPRGYCEYTVAAAPAANLSTSINLSGETVVKVFNNLIPMNFIELNTLSKSFTKTYNASSQSKYGFLNEWWFSHGWSVGGNCIAWDNEKEQHVFTLGDKTTGYMVTEPTTIDGVSYNTGDILGYNARKYLANNPSAVNDSLYPLPSQYEQFRDYSALSQTTDKNIDATTKGYGVSPSPDTFSDSSKIKYFTSGQTAMLVESFTALQTIVDSTTATVNIAPLYAFRSFEGEGDLGSDTLKVVGKEYAGVVFEGKLTTVNGCEIKNVSKGGSDNIGFTIPANSNKKEEAWKFLQYLCSKKGQAKISVGNNGVPTNESYALSNDYATQSSRLVKNYAAAGMMATTSEIGDWSYLGDKEWISDWSVDLNGPVRNGTMTLDAFFAEWNPKINGDVGYSKSLKLDKYFNVQWYKLR